VTWTIGIVTGLAAEAEVLRTAKVDAVVRCCGASPERALLAARQLIAEGARALLSFGVAGALANIAQPGQIVVSHATYRLTQHAFAFEPLGELALKGFLRPVAAFNVLGFKTA